MSISSRALNRRAKAYLRRNELVLYLPTLPGFEWVAADELRACGYSPDIARGGVSFHGDMSSVYEVNLSHRSGSRVLLRVGEFLAQNYPMLYHHTLRTPWETLLGNCPSLRVRASFRSSRLQNRAHIEEVVQQAIEARLRRFGLSIQVRATPAVTIHARIFRDRCTISQDTTGEHLHKRGYRTEPSEAPIRETSAAAVLLAAKAASYELIVDPFCGSGTIPIEADLLMRNSAPGLKRGFSIECSPLHSRGTLAETRRRVEGRCCDSSGKRILGFDISQDAVDLASRAAHRAQTSLVSFNLADAREIDFGNLARSNKRGLIATNVPYGVRLGTEDSATQLLEDFAKQVRLSAKGWQFAIVTPDREVLADALPVDKTLPFQNGGIRVYALFGHVPS